MTRKEEIYKAARDYVSSILLSSPSDVIHFEYGAKWADKNPTQDVVNLNDIWRDASEEPQDGSHILIQYNWEGDKELKSYHIKYDEYVNWKKLITIYEISQWAYICDLLPKQFGISDQLKKDKEKKN